ncbi:MAG: cyclic pyranopterin monophosphate synthase MoaC [Pseudomonadota bacterium]
MSNSTPDAPAQLSHINTAGEANMVDVAAKASTARVARAQAVVSMQPATMQAIEDNQLAKGEVLAVARVAGIQAAKRCADLIPLCHPLPLTKVQIEFKKITSHQLRVIAECRVTGQTGVEMEALTAASVASLTIYDMCKAIDKAMVVDGLCLLEKRGGKSGDFLRQDLVQEETRE